MKNTKIKLKDTYEIELWVRTYTTCLNNILQVPQVLGGSLEQGVSGCAIIADMSINLFRERRNEVHD